MREPSEKTVVMHFLHFYVQIQSKFITDLVHYLLIIAGLSVVIHMNRSNFCEKKKRERFYCIVGSQSRSKSK